MPLIEQFEGKSLELKKHIGLIHSTNKLTLLERKIANALLYHAYEELLTKTEHVIHIPSLCVLIGYNSKDYKTIKSSLISLISTVLEWNLLDNSHGKKSESEGQGVWMASAMLSDAKIEGSMCTYSYSNRMKELCHYPEFYGRLNLKILSQFKSTYGLALYENCIRFQNIPQTPWLDLPLYRKLMGVSDSKYPIFRDLNNRVIRPSVKEVNQYSPIQVEPEFRKAGAKVVALRFLISKKFVFKEIDQNQRKEGALADRLKEDYGLSEKQWADIKSRYSETYLLEKLTLIESSHSYQTGKIKNLAKYLEKALSDDYQKPKSSKEAVKKLESNRKVEQSLRQLREEETHQYRLYQDKTLFQVFDGLDDQKKKNIEKHFDQHISKTLYSKAFVQTGFSDPLVRDCFIQFLKKYYPELSASLLSFEEYCQQSKKVYARGLT